MHTQVTLINIMTDTEKYTCPICNETIERTSERRHNELRHHEQGALVVCTYPGCGKYYKSKDGMKSHFRSRHTDEKHTCGVCGDVFDTSQKLTNHKGYQHENKGKCPHPGCDKNLASKQNLQRHINLPSEKGGHGGRLPETETEKPEEVGNRRKVEEKKDVTDPIEDFLMNMRERLKDINPEKPRCRSKKICSITRLSHGFPGENKTYCSKHKDEVHGLVYSKKPCRVLGCITGGDFMIGGFRFCSDHRDQLILEGLPDPGRSVKKPKLYRKTCIEKGCRKVASCDEGNYCVPHSPTGISDDKRMCDVKGCDVKRPTFGYPDQTPMRCKDHREEGMYSHKLCEEEGCYISASYGLPGGKATHCVKHRPKGCVLNMKTCVVAGCDLQPSYGPEGGTVYTHCSHHRPETYIDVRNIPCSHEGCTKNRSFGVKGGERMWCVEHKTEDCINLVETICSMACCTNGSGMQAIFFHPDHEDTTSAFYKKRICSFGRRVLIEDALMHNDIVKLQELLTHFDLDNVLTLNAQSAFRFACEENFFKELGDCADIVFDRPVANGPKILGAKRPDIFYKWVVDGLGYGIHIEYDESPGHEDCKDRLEWIAKDAGCDSRVYVIRVEGGHGTKNPICTRVDMENYGYYKITEEGRRVASRVSDAVVQRIKWIQEGLVPCDFRPAKIYF